MKATSITCLCTGIAAAILLATAAWAELPSSHIMMMPDELQWAGIPSLPPGAKVAIIEGPMNEAVPFIARLWLPGDYQVPAHSHPTIEHVTVLSGTLHMGMGDKLDTMKSSALSVGSVAVMQAGTNHYAWTSEETIVQVHGVGPWGINYVNPVDDPRNR